MIGFLLWAQLAAASQMVDSTYATPALRALVAAVATSNRQPPIALGGYTSHIETEVSLLIRDSLGREHTAEVEQMATAGSWKRDGEYDLHVVGYRSQSVGVPYSTLSIIRGWTVPTLYGERLSLGTYFARNRSSRPDTTSLVAVHPFAADRDRYYTFSGGDTVTILNAGTRRIPIVRIRVQPAPRSAGRLDAFDGEIDVDAQRFQIVRMRGQIVALDDRPKLSERFTRAALGVTAAAYIEFVNSEIAGQYWLPTYQRTEFQAGFALFGNARPVFRIVSNISDITPFERDVTSADSAEQRRVTITWAPSDSIDRFHDWRNELGLQSATVHSDDFNDLAPDAWRPTGPPRLSLFPNTVSRIFRFNRVEGLFLGVAPSVDFRSAAPGLSVGAYGGWAFSEKTLRGGAFASQTRGNDSYGARLERTIATTNDFTVPFSDDPGLAALFGSVDNYDYVDRATALLSATHVFGSVSSALLTLQGGAGHDGAERARLSRGLFGARSFRANRGVAPGAYAIGKADLEWHPNVTGDYVTPGIGARLHHEVASGDIAWQRTELSLASRRYLGPISLALHADGGLVVGAHPPPQQLFELGGNELLPGYEYKQFAGDRAALFRAYSSYRFNLLKRPIRFRNFYIPGVSPGIGASIQGGWTESSSPAAREAVRALGVDANGVPLSTSTGGVRATAGGGLTFFSDLLHVGAARPIDRPASWRFVFGFGTAF
jgi:hypothetical protein